MPKPFVKLMQSVSGEKPKMWGPSIVGFGSYHYKYDSGREGDMPLLCFSPRKVALVLRNMTGHSDPKELPEKLGKHKLSRGRILFKELADAGRQDLKALIARTHAAMCERYPGQSIQKGPGSPDAPCLSH